MDFKSTIDLIIKDLNEASEIIDDLKKYPGVSVLQVELAKTKCKSAAEVISILKNLDDLVTGKNQEQNSIPAKHQEPSSEKHHEHKPVAAQKDETPIPEPAMVSPVTRAREPKPVNTINPPKETRETKKPAGKTIETSVADKFTSHPDLYEGTLNVRPEKDLSDRLKRKPINNLADAIGLNDRFLFISEIFDGNKDAFSQAISKLDKAENLPDAMAIIMSYTGEKPENEAVIQLLDLVRLKFPADE